MTSVPCMTAIAKPLSNNQLCNPFALGQVQGPGTGLSSPGSCLSGVRALPHSLGLLRHTAKAFPSAKQSATRWALLMPCRSSNVCNRSK